MRVQKDQVAHVAELGLLPTSLAVEPGVRIGGRGVRVVAPSLAMEVALGVAPTARVARRRFIAAFRLGLEALHASAQRRSDNSRAGALVCLDPRDRGVQLHERINLLSAPVH